MKFKDIKNVFKNSNTKIILLFSIFWMINLIIKNIFLNIDTPLYSFPISEVSGPRINESGLWYSILFLLLLLYFFFSKKISGFITYLFAVSFLLLGNLAQGGIHWGFKYPLLNGGDQLFNQSIKIQNWVSWLTNYNSIQSGLNSHARTHPPFATLVYKIHNLIPENFLSLEYSTILIMTLLGLSLIPLFSILLKNLDVSANFSYLVILFSLIPSINIYSLISIDSLILLFSMLYFIGIAIVLKENNRVIGFLLIFSGLVIANLLTFAGTFLILFGFVFSLINYISTKNYKVFKFHLIAVTLFVILLFLFTNIIGYNHVSSFLTATKIENPNGFSLISNPIEYFLTRIEGGLEILLFLSIPLATKLYDTVKNNKGNIISNIKMQLFWAGSFSFILMLLTGAFRTGETARIALFIYPLLLMPLLEKDSIISKKLLLFVGIQTTFMQTIANYFW